ncbi:MAG: DUF3592 domain-containing protein [Alphaproteobacteria bacterium]|nr:DUF3592 domain-containing protein [Alphaproteobacteria bacterium]
MFKVYLILIGATFVLAALWLAIARVRSLRRPKVVVGRVVDWAVRSDGETPPTVFYHAVVVFHDMDGVERRFVSGVGYDRPQHPAGDTLTVEYDPTMPERAVEATFAARWGFSAAIAGLGVVALLFGLVM